MISISNLQSGGSTFVCGSVNVQVSSLANRDTYSELLEQHPAVIAFRKPAVVRFLQGRDMQAQLEAQLHPAICKSTCDGDDGLDGR